MLLLRHFVCGLVAFSCVRAASGQELHTESFLDVSSQMGVSPLTGETLSTLWLDFNNDGLLDLWFGNHIGLNDPYLLIGDGNGSFVDITSSVWSANTFRDTHGSSWADFDRDGDLDLMEGVGAIRGTATGRNYFFVNENGQLVDRAAERGVDNEFGQSRTPVWYDWDRDGLLDVILATRYRDDLNLPSILFRQQAGNFVDVSDVAGFFPDRHAVFAVLADLSGDKESDVVLHGYDFPHRVYDGTTQPFIDLAPELFPGLQAEYVHDITIADLNGDQYNDIFLTRWAFPSQFATANDTMLVTRLMPRDSELRFKTAGRVTLHSVNSERLSAGWNFHLGDGGHELPGDPTVVVLDPADTLTHGFPATDVGILVGYDTISGEWTIGQGRSPRGFGGFLAVVSSSMPISDISISGGPPTFFVNALWMYDSVQEIFVDATSASGFSSSASCTSAAAADLDNDADLDLVLACAKPFQMLETKVFKNDGLGSFTEVAASAGAVRDTVGRGYEVMATPARVAAADFNRDGFVDLLFPSMARITILRQPVLAFPEVGTQLFRNQGNTNHWIEIGLVGSVSNTEAIGARVDVVAGGRTQFREKGRGVHRYAQDDPILHFGLGTETIVDSIVVSWPSGIVQVMTDVAADQVLQITETDIALPVEIIGLSATIESGDVLLGWSAISSPDADSYEIVQVVGDVEIRIGEISDVADTGTLSSYVFRIHEPPSGEHTYRIRIVYADGSVARSSNVSVSVPYLTSRFEMYPSPAAGQINVRLIADTAGDVEIEAYDLLGRRVLQLHQGRIEVGEVELSVSTSSLPSGTYLFRVKGLGPLPVKRVLVAK